MPTMKEHYAALKAASAAGDQEAVQYIRSQLVAEQQAADKAQYNPTNGMSGFEKFRAGVGQGMTNVARQAGNMVGVVSDEDMADYAAADQPLMDTGAGKVGSFIGETAAVVPLTMTGVGAVGRAGQVGANVARNIIGRGITEGAIQGAVTAGPGNRFEGAIQGGAAGAVLPAAAAGFKVAKAGVNPTVAARRLMNQGVELTPGQMNPAGFVNQMEEVAQAAPFGIGTVVKGARDKGYQQFQAKVIQDVAPPGVSVRPNTDVALMVDDVAKAYDSAYGFAKGFPVKPLVMRTQGGDVPLLSLFRKAANNAGTRASKEESGAMQKYLQSELSRIRSGNATSDDLLSIRSNIRKAIREEGGSATAKGRILKIAEKDVTDALESQLPPDVMKALKATDTQYGKFKIVEDAVYRAKDQTESFTPSQFSQAVREATQKGEYARGGGRLREQSKAAVDVFQPRQPLTGRQLLTAGPVYAAAAANPVMLGAPLAGATLGLYGTKYGNALAAGRTGLQRGARAAERELRRKIPKEGREVIAAYGRNALANYVND